MKKITLICLAALTMLFASCGGSNTVTYSPANPYWQGKDNYTTAVDSSVNELCTYSLTWSKAAISPNASVAVEYDEESTYTTRVSASTYPAENGTACYLFETELNVSGKFTAGEEIKEFTDKTTSKTYFTWNKGILPIASFQDAQSTLPVNASGAKDEHGNTFITTHYATEIVYANGTATAKFNVVGTDEEKAEMANYFALKDGATLTFKKYDKTNFVDSNMLAFFGRSFDYVDGLSYSFTSIDILANKKHNMRLYASKAETVSLAKFSLNGQNYTHTQAFEQPGYLLELGISDTYAGSTMSVKYLTDTNHYNHFMAEMNTALPYGLGNLKYTLVSVNK